MPLTANDKKHLALCQSEYDTAKARLVEYDRITQNVSDDPHIKEALARARGYIEGLMVQWKRNWYSSINGAQDVELLADLLKL